MADRIYNPDHALVRTKHDLARLKHLTRINHEGCWEWCGYRDKDGYGRFAMEGVQWFAHRAAYVLRVGLIPPGMVLDHRCRNPACCNPLHLELITRAENTRRGISPSACNARKTKCVHGHAFDDPNTYRHRGRRSCRACNRAAVAKYKMQKRGA